jgi:hypothetical protein
MQQIGAYAAFEKNSIHSVLGTRLREQWAWQTIVPKTSWVWTRYAHAPYEPKHHDDDQNEPQNAAEPSSPIATMRIIPTTATENQNQYNNDKNGAHA